MTLLLYLAAIALTYFFILELIAAVRSIRSTNWPFTEGTLDHWDMNWKSGGEGDKFHFRSIDYSYTVHGKTYQSNNLGYGFPSSLEAEYVSPTVREVFSNAPALKVYYHPRRPEQSVLTTGVKRYHILKIFALCIVSVVLTIAIRDA